MPIDLSGDLWRAIRDRNRTAYIIIEIAWPEGTEFYGGPAGFSIDEEGHLHEHRTAPIPVED
ncbi:MAG: hypothetical protein GY847_01450 [Proteobacteria bacterium]|nr:hypothetical protein [Pseudomonadota bacterium]